MLSRVRPRQNIQPLHKPCKHSITHCFVLRLLLQCIFSSRSQLNGSSGRSMSSISYAREFKLKYQAMSLFSVFFFFFLFLFLLLLLIFFIYLFNFLLFYFNYLFNFLLFYFILFLFLFFYFFYFFFVHLANKPEYVINCGFSSNVTFI